eukprot:3985332-Amphidinium_carterae.2
MPNGCKTTLRSRGNVPGIVESNTTALPSGGKNRFRSWWMWQSYNRHRFDVNLSTSSWNSVVIKTLICVPHSLLQIRGSERFE